MIPNPHEDVRSVYRYLVKRRPKAKTAPRTVVGDRIQLDLDAVVRKTELETVRAFADTMADAVEKGRADDLVNGDGSAEVRLRMRVRIAGYLRAAAREFADMAREKGMEKEA